VAIVGYFKCNNTVEVVCGYYDGNRKCDRNGRRLRRMRLWCGKKKKKQKNEVKAK
jgi:hypothetical protein